MNSTNIVAIGAFLQKEHDMAKAFQEKRYRFVMHIWAEVWL